MTVAPRLLLAALLASGIGLASAAALQIEACARTSPSPRARFSRSSTASA